MRFLFLVFILFPVLEVLLLIRVAAFVGGWNVVVWIFFSAFLGWFIMSEEGRQALIKARQRSETGESPLADMLNGFSLALAGILLMLPGLITDFIGLCCWVPWVRRSLARRLLANAQWQSWSGYARYNDDGDIIEGEFHEEKSSDDSQKRLR